MASATFETSCAFKGALRDMKLPNFRDAAVSKQLSLQYVTTRERLINRVLESLQGTDRSCVAHGKVAYGCRGIYTGRSVLLILL